MMPRGQRKLRLTWRTRCKGNETQQSSNMPWGLCWFLKQKALSSFLEEANRTAWKKIDGVKSFLSVLSLFLLPISVFFPLALAFGYSQHSSPCSTQLSQLTSTLLANISSSWLSSHIYPVSLLLKHTFPDLLRHQGQKGFHTKPHLHYTNQDRTTVGESHSKKSIMWWKCWKHKAGGGTEPVQTPGTLQSWLGIKKCI